ncbi:hypothetical protein [Flagellimonas lutaonensis]|uniref:Uncharacterized protein n=1 Tax=Flagellimonas lutaonensis TaxID=516051 RepID=A0A0D5YPN0_9FLAO|nr:hypothetical protein [Allomuricauda lutaonensis]AKA33838.1 hypothetical protein VC82_146 [Allomuricauda lutaonensis]
MKNSILILLLISFSCSGQEKNCSEYKTGKFNYVLENRPELIIRTDSTQIELNPITKVEVYSKVKWKSECEYEMIYEKVLNYPEDVSHMIGQKINVKIIETSSDGYKVHATSPRIDNILEFVKAE